VATSVIRAPAPQTNQAARQRWGSSRVPHMATLQAPPLFTSSGCAGAQILAATIRTNPTPKAVLPGTLKGTPAPRQARDLWS